MNLSKSKGMHFNLDLVWSIIFQYLRYSLSLRQLEEIMKIRGVSVDHSTIHRWIIKFVPAFEKKFQKHKMPVLSSWYCDETYIKVSGKGKYLYRAVDRNDDTIDFLLTAKRDLRAARRFFKKAIKANGLPKKITIDKSGANKAAADSVNEDLVNKSIEVRQNKYLNNMIEQNHRSLKKRTNPMMGFKNFNSAKILIAGIEIVGMIFKGQSNYLPLFNYQNPYQAFVDLIS